MQSELTNKGNSAKGAQQESFGKELGHQKTCDIERVPTKTQEENVEISKTQNNFETCRYHPSIDHQEVVGAQEQRLPSYEVQNTQEHKAKGLRKASANLQAENIQLPEPEDFEDDAFTTGLLTKNYKETSKVGEGEFPISKEDAFTDLTHPMRKHSTYERPFLNIDEEPEYTQGTENAKNEGYKSGFTGQPIITVAGNLNLKSNIDDQPSPISNTEKYTKDSRESSQQENDSEKTTAGAQKDLNVRPSNFARESNQGNETKKQKKINNEPVDKENTREPTAV